MKNLKTRPLFTVIFSILTITTFIFAFIYSKNLLSQINDFNTSIQRFLLAVLFMIIYYSLFALHWYFISCSINKQLNIKQSLAFFASQPYKYLPTSLFTMSFRAVYAKKLGMNLKESSVAQLIENFNIIFSGILLGLLLFALEYDIATGLLFITITTILIICMNLWDFKIKIPKTNREVSFKKESRMIVLCIAGWLFSALAFYTISNEQSTFLLAGSAHSCSIASGILAVFAPGGIGVREFVLSNFGIAAYSILVWRVFTLFADLLLGLITIGFIKFKYSKH